MEVVAREVGIGARNAGALARGCAVQARPRAGLDCGGAARGGDHHGGDDRSEQERVVPRARRYTQPSWTNGAPAPRRRWPSPRRPAPARRPPGKTASASRSSSASCCAKTGLWPRPQPCWCCQKKSRRSSTRERTNDRPRRSPSLAQDIHTAHSRRRAAAAWPARSPASTCAPCSAGRPMKGS